MEENAFFDGETVRYIDSRQEELFLIPRPMPHLKDTRMPANGQ